jgi:hypothetical protein
VPVAWHRFFQRQFIRADVLHAVRQSFGFVIKDQIISGSWLSFMAVSLGFSAQDYRKMFESDNFPRESRIGEVAALGDFGTRSHLILISTLGIQMAVEKNDIRPRAAPAPCDRLPASHNCNKAGVCLNAACGCAVPVYDLTRVEAQPL